jgi:flagellar biosynthesis protein FlhF
MKTETFQAENMQKALSLVQKELGDEALVISVRQVPGGPLWQVWKQPNVEVVAGVPDDEEDLSVNQSTQKEQKKYDFVTNDKEDINVLSDLYNPDKGSQVDTPRTIYGAYQSNQYENISAKPENKESNVNFRKNLDDLYAGKNRISVNSKRDKEDGKAEQLKKFAAILPTLPIESTMLLQKLLKQGVSEEYVYKATSMLQNSLTDKTKNNPDKIQKFLQKQFEASINGSKTIIGVNPKIICLIGTSGVGKTSAIAKLATFYGRRLHKKVTWICADTVRAGAIAEANTYVETIGATLKISYTPDDLRRSVDEAIHENAEYILIDTPAFNPNRENSVFEIGNLVTVIPKRNTWLVAPSTAKESDLKQLYAAVSHLRIRGTVITKLDETNTFGAIFNLLVDQKLPLNFMTFGSNLVNDLIEGDPAVFVSSMFEERFAG